MKSLGQLGMSSTGAAILSVNLDRRTLRVRVEGKSDCGHQRVSPMMMDYQSSHAEDRYRCTREEQKKTPVRCMFVRVSPRSISSNDGRSGLRSRRACTV